MADNNEINNAINQAVERRMEAALGRMMESFNARSQEVSRNLLEEVRSELAQHRVRLLTM